MAKLLTTLLGASEPIFSAGMTKLEKTTGNGGIDVRLIADITEIKYKVMRRLGLDVSDTTGHELYFALIAAIRRGEGAELLADADYVLTKIDDQIISFNLIDVIENSHHELSYQKQIFNYGRRSLRGELVSRYMNHARTNNETTKAIAKSIGLMPEADTWYNYGTVSKVGAPKKELF
jgi:hypothetical protein